MSLDQTVEVVPKVQLIGPMTKALYGSNWLWGGWTPVYTANTTGTVDDGWVTAFNTTAPVTNDGSAGLVDVAFNGNFGQKLNYGRECITRELFGWRVLINGTAVGTRSSAVVHYNDERTNLGDETINPYMYKPVGGWHWVRNSVPTGAAIEVQYRRRHIVVSGQTNTYARFISGVYRGLNVHFSPRNVEIV